MLNFKKEDWITYIPAYNGNRDDENPMTVEIHPLSHGEIVKYTDSIHVKQRDGFRGQVQSNQSAVQRRQFRDNVRKPLNCTINGAIIENSVQIYDDGPFDLVKEIFGAMENVSSLAEDEVKNSD